MCCAKDGHLCLVGVCDCVDWGHPRMLLGSVVLVVHGAGFVTEACIRAGHLRE